MISKLIIFLITLISIKSYSQSNVLSAEYIESKINRHKTSSPSIPLYLHIDKNVYTNNEPIWFSAYLLNAESSFEKHNILAISIIDDINNKVFLTEKYQMENALSFGSLTLPDSIPPGNYNLIASTNIVDKNNKPICIFNTKIVIKSVTQQEFTSSIILVDTTIHNGVVRAKVLVNTKKNNSETKPLIEYSIGSKLSRATIETNKDFLISITEKELNLPNPVLQVKIKHNNQSQYLNIKLPKNQTKRINVNFFPESGNLSSGLPNLIGWEATTEEQIPISVKGILFEDETPIDTIETNSYGSGKFNLIPQLNSKYSLKIISGNYLKSDTIFILPEAIDIGFSLHLPRSVTNDTLKVTMVSKENKSVQILLKNNNGDFAFYDSQATTKAKTIKLPLYNLPKGIWTITILDKGKPIAERLFFAQYNSRVITKINFNSKIYKKKDSLYIKINLTDNSGKSVEGLFSVSSIQQNRLTSSFNNIENYIYLNHELGFLPKDPTGNGLDNLEYVDYMLLIKGWRRYTWQDVLKADTTQKYTSLSISGRVKYKNKPLKQSVQLAIVGGDTIGLINTENDGTFILEREKIFAGNGKKVTVMVSGKNNEAYQIEVNDPYPEINSLIAQKKINVEMRSVSNLLNSTDNELKGLQNAYNLQDVTIKVKNSSGSIFAFKGEPGTNDCGDFVDEAGHFNYEKATKRFKPKPNTMYVIRTDLSASGDWFKVKPYYYIGCKELEKTMLKISGIYSERIFYGVNNNDREIQYLSTLFWKPGIKTNSKGEAQFSFKTGDIADNFKIVIQGITKDDVFSGTESFSVQ